ncbi:MAG TPA: Eco57I restriction-modification methylase domain-containing protein, partial [Spirochaetota bacterium]|nr:Eco57I restriction-modification methylase domain-containing protein [Spirochaetota bacterium]
KVRLDKRGDILRNNIFGVDIDHEATEVSIMSLYLKMLDDGFDKGQQDLFFAKGSILPDMSENIKCGNSLIGSDYFDGKLDIDLEELRTIKPFDWAAEGTFNKETKTWINRGFPEIMKNGGFDCVIGNPPYVKEYTSKDSFENIKRTKLSRYYQGKMDLWQFFVCLGLDIIKKTSLIGFITPNNWVTNTGASIMRNKILSDSKIIRIIDFYTYMVFDCASIQTMVFILEKGAQERYKFDYVKVAEKEVTEEMIKDILEGGRIGTKYLQPLIIAEQLENQFLVFNEGQVDRILQNIQKKKNFSIDSNSEITNGIHPHYDFISKQMAEKTNGLFVKDQGIFALSHQEKEDLGLSEDELKLCKPYYRNTKQLWKWYGDHNNEYWIIYTTSDYKESKRMHCYPNLKKHLDKFKNIISSDNKPYGLHRSREEKYFTGEKIVSVRKCISPTFTYSDFDCYASAAFYIIKSDRIDMKYLTAILNSKVVEFWLKNKGKMQGDLYQVDKEPILAIPIYDTIDKVQKEEIIRNVEQIIDIIKRSMTMSNESDKNLLWQRLRSIEQSVNEQVYQLYDLTPEEIKIIEESTTP